MAKRSLADPLNLAVEALLHGPEANLAPAEPVLAPLLEIARELRDLPRESFKPRLKAELERKATMASIAEPGMTTQQTAAAYLSVRNAAAAIEWYRKAFGAREIMRLEDRGKIGHAEIAMGNSILMLADEYPDYGFVGPQALGGSPVRMHLYVDDVDAVAAQAVAAGAQIVRPVQDQFYGDRSGQVADPFGYTWILATRKEEISLEEMQRRLAALEGEQKPAVGRTTVTPYLVAADAPALIDFVQRAFGAKEQFRAIGGAGGVHANLQIGDSLVMLGGGAPDLAWRGQTWPTALHIYVEDVDAAHRRALEAGGVEIGPPTDQEYGERSSGVKDPAGNYWYIATAQGESHIPKGLQTVNPYLHPRRAEPLLLFLGRAFDVSEVEKYASPDGVVHHARVRVGSTVIEMGEAHGPYQPMPTMFYVSVPDADAAFRRAVAAGAAPLHEPQEQPYGDRVGSVQDAFGNQWYLATPARKAPE